MDITIKHIYLSKGHNYIGRHGLGSLDYRIEEQESVECVAGRGIRGDRFFDHKEDFKGQITFFDWAVYEKVRDEVAKGALDPSDFRRNVVTDGVDLNELIDKRFTIGDLEFTGSCECSPCYWMDEACGPGAFEFLKGYGGLRARISQGGGLQLGKYKLKVVSL